MLPLNSRKVLYHIKSRLSNGFLKKTDKNQIKTVLFCEKANLKNRNARRETVLLIFLPQSDGSHLTCHGACGKIHIS